MAVSSDEIEPFCQLLEGPKMIYIGFCGKNSLGFVRGLDKMVG
jgi:hypothetical protein